MTNYRHNYGASQRRAAPVHSKARWSVVIPAYNEEDFLPATLASITAQTVADAVIILVDNRSSDATRAVMETFAEENPDRDVVLLSDPRPGKVNALETGIAAVKTDFVALCDADTIYPPDYLERAEAMMGHDESGVVAAFAFGVFSDASAFDAWLARTKGAVVAALMPGQGHTGGFGHAFRTRALKKAGGYSSKIWPFMVADHEIVNRVAKHGTIAYHRDHWCQTSSRRARRSHVDWKLHERIMYNFTPAHKRDWLFYEYLRPRFEKRKLFNANLRKRDWDQSGS